MATNIEVYPDRQFVLSGNNDKITEKNLSDDNKEGSSDTNGVTRRSFLKISGMFLAITSLGGFTLFAKSQIEKNKNAKESGFSKVAKAVSGYGPGSYGR